MVNLILLGTLTACSGSSMKETGYTPTEIGEMIIEKQSGLPELTALTAEDDYFFTYLSDFYLLNDESVKDGVIYYADGVEATEIAILVMKEETGTESVGDMLNEYLTSRADVFEGYAPQQAEMVRRGITVVNGRYAALLICSDTQRAKEAFMSCFEDSQAIAQKTRYEEADSYEEADKYEETDKYEESDRYDEAAVVLAWQTGDETALSEMNRSILAAAKDVIAQEISDSMNDYEKELAIHDWMTGWSSFDMNVFSHAPDARAEADNRNPYGFLINRSAMCHGYSSTFQLFMDMLDIQCITVYGIPGSNGVEHSWNMVRLEGEWYCVDTAWDDPIGGTPGHTYFNVTSQRLRSGNIHRWDDSDVPEATATAYAYKNQ